jgi:hypothetical protein
MSIAMAIIAKPPVLAGFWVNPKTSPEALGFNLTMMRFFTKHR